MAFHYESDLDRQQAQIPVTPCPPPARFANFERLKLEIMSAEKTDPEKRARELVSLYRAAFGLIGADDESPEATFLIEDYRRTFDLLACWGRFDRLSQMAVIGETAVNARATDPLIEQYELKLLAMAQLVPSEPSGAGGADEFWD